MGTSFMECSQRVAKTGNLTIDDKRARSPSRAVKRLTSILSWSLRRLCYSCFSAYVAALLSG